VGDVLVQVSPVVGQVIYSEDLGPISPPLESFRARAGEVAETITEVATSLKGHLDSMLEHKEGLAPDEVEVNFGLELQAGASAIITKVAAGCTFTVRLTWTRGSQPK
jgi:hypothetical protein